MKVYGDINLLNNKLLNAEFSDNITIEQLPNFPVAHSVGHIAFVDDVLYICIDTTPSDVWVPLTRELTAYKHSQSPASTTWEIQHDLNTTDITVMVYDTTDHVIIPDSIRVTGVNTVELGFASAIAGKAVIVTGSIDGPVRKTPDGSVIVDWSNIDNKPAFSTVATSGSYADLTNKPSLATVATSGSFTDLSNTPTLSNIFVVAKNGNNTTGDGSFSKPFATIQKAHDVAEATIASSQGVTILIMPGTYTDALAITRPRTAFVGFSGFEWSTIIQTAVTITPSRRVAHPGNSPFSFENIFLNVPSGQDAITFTGSTFSGALNLDRVRIYTTNGKGIVMNNTATDFDATVGAANNRMKWVDVDIQTNNGNKNAVEVQNAYGSINGGYFFSGSAQAAVMGLGANVTCTNCTFEATGATVASVATGGSLLSRASSFKNNQADANGVDVAANAYFVVAECTFAHSTTASNTGFAIKGVTGSVIIYSYLTFVNNNPANLVVNNRVSAAASRIPMTTAIAAV